jgi:hypothetical protein
VDELISPLSTVPVTRPETRFLAWGIGLVELAGGLTMLLLPFLFEGVLYDSLRPRLVPFGLLASGVGLLLLVWQFLRLETTRLPRISLLAGGAVALLSAVTSLVTQTLTATPFSIAFGAVAVLAAIGAAAKLPRRIADNLFASALPHQWLERELCCSFSAISLLRCTNTFGRMAPNGRSECSSARQCSCFGCAIRATGRPELCRCSPAYSF